MALCLPKSRLSGGTLFQERLTRKSTVVDEGERVLRNWRQSGVGM